MAAPPKPQAEEVDEPKFEWVQKDGFDTLLVHLPGYLKENLKVQVTTSRIRVLGEKKINEMRSSRFQKEFSLSEDCDVSKITAMFEGGILQVRLPKMEEKHTAAADKGTEDKKFGDKADESLRKIKEMVQDGKEAEQDQSRKVGEKARGQGNGREEEITTEKKHAGNLWARTLLAVLIFAVALGLGMLRTKGGIHRIINEGWWVKRNPHQM